MSEAGPTPQSKPKPSGPAARDAILEAAMRLAARRDFDEVTITDIAREAGVELADFRDLFPSKGAVIGGFSRKIDRKVLDAPKADFSSEPARERLYQILRQRLEALAPYRDALASIARWAAKDPLTASALNRETVNSMRFMLEAADIDSDGALGALKLQGLALAWGRVLDVWFDDDSGSLTSALDALDSELDKGQRNVDWADQIVRATGPLRSLARGVMAGFGWRGRRDGGRHHGRDDYYPNDGA